MQHATHPPTTTTGNAAAVVLLAALAAVLALAVAVTVHPVPLGGVALLAVLLGVVGVMAGAYGEAVAR